MYVLPFLLWHLMAMAIKVRPMEASRKTARITCNACISACERGSQWELALELWSQVQRQGLQSTAVTHHAAAAASLSVGGWGVDVEWCIE